MRRAALVCAVVARVLGCPNECSQNGYCNKDTAWECLCDEGFTGPLGVYEFSLSGGGGT